MPDVMKTLLLNPPSFENFDGGASSRWPATREIESYWYPVWLSYPAGLIPGSRLLDASPHKINWQQTVEICKDYEFLVLFTSTVGFDSDIKLLRKIKEANPSMQVAFVGPHGHIKPDETLNTSEDIDFIVRGEFDHAVRNMLMASLSIKSSAPVIARTARSSTTLHAGNCIPKNWMPCRSHRRLQT